MVWVTIASFRDLPEALLAAGKLASAGIASYLINEEVIGLDWLWSNAIGGVKLSVADEDADDAFGLLAMPIPDVLPQDPEPEYRQPACPKCGSLDIGVFQPGLEYRLLVMSFLGLPVPFPRSPRWRCENCWAQWKRSGQ